MTLIRESKTTGLKPVPGTLRPPEIPNRLVWYGTEASVLSMFPRSIVYRDVCDLRKYKHNPPNIYHIRPILPFVTFSWSGHQTHLGMNSFRTPQKLTRERKWHLWRVFQYVFFFFRYGVQNECLHGVTRQELRWWPHSLRKCVISLKGQSLHRKTDSIFLCIHSSVLRKKSATTI